MNTTLDAAQVSAIWAAVVSGSSLYPINEDDLTGVMHLMPARTLGDDVAEFGHRQIGAVLLEQLVGVVLPCPTALVASDPDQR